MVARRRRRMQPQRATASIIAIKTKPPATTAPMCDALLKNESEEVDAVPVDVSNAFVGVLVTFGDTRDPVETRMSEDFAVVVVVIETMAVTPEAAVVFEAEP
jgi:hypothetical protein